MSEEQYYYTATVMKPVRMYGKFRTWEQAIAWMLANMPDNAVDVDAHWERVKVSRGLPARDMFSEIQYGPPGNKPGDDIYGRFHGAHPYKEPFEFDVADNGIIINGAGLHIVIMTDVDSATVTIRTSGQTIEFTGKHKQVIIPEAGIIKVEG